VGFFHKNVSNFIGQSTVTATPFNIPTPVGGAYWNAALANGCAAGNTTCIRNYIFSHYAGQPGVTAGPLDSNGNLTGTITGQPGDPITSFKINTPVNAAFDSLHGFEFNVQSELAYGFGIAANYTLVISGLRYDNNSTAAQYALPGLSNTANVVAYYEDQHYNARIAYNWRGQFLAGTIDGGGFNNPIYTEAYHQIDATLGWNVTDHFSLTLDGINLTDGVIRQHERTKEELVSITQTGRRFMLGARYKF
jgi:TonB-dependent receptor